MWSYTNLRNGLRPGAEWKVECWTSTGNTFMILRSLLFLNPYSNQTKKCKNITTKEYGLLTLLISFLIKLMADVENTVSFSSISKQVKWIYITFYYYMLRSIKAFQTRMVILLNVSSSKIKFYHFLEIVLKCMAISYVFLVKVLLGC